MYCSPVIADVDGDGRNELVARNLESLSVWKTPSVTPISIATENLQSGFQVVAVGDADNDGVTEIVSANGHGLLSVHRLERQRLVKVTEQQVPAMSTITSLLIADVNGDKRPEIVVSGQKEVFDGSVDVFVYGLEKDILKEHARIPTPGDMFDAARYADADNDGRREIVASGIKRQRDGTRTWNGIVAWRYASTGRYEPVFEYQVKSQGPESMDVGDTDGDGKNEIVAATNGFKGELGPTIYVLRHEKGTTTELFTEPMDSAAHYCGITIGDVDNDGKNEFSRMGKHVYRYNPTTKGYAKNSVPNIRQPYYSAIGDLPI